jgi:hypothetical protein
MNALYSHILVKTEFSNINDRCFMNSLNVGERIKLAMTECSGVTSSVHRFGGTEYKLGKREIGHVHACVPEYRTSACRHGNYLVDIPFPMKIRNAIIENGEAEPHHILPDSGWVSVFIRNESDIERAISLLKKSYNLAVKQMEKRINEKEC